MKIKGFVMLSALVLLILPMIFAVEFEVNGNFSQGETILTRVSGNFVVPLTEENFFFYKGHVRIPMEYDIMKIQDDYYFYASLVGKTPGNYSVSIENAKYMKGNEVSEEYIVRNFSITNATADFSVKPGFASVSGNFYLEVQNLLDKQIAINVNTASSNASGRDILVADSGSKESSVSVKSGEVKKINFVLGTGNATFHQIELKSGNLTYKVPVYVSASPPISSQPASSIVKLEPSELISSVPTNTVTKKIIFLYNIGSKEMTNISFSLSNELSPFVNLSLSHMDILEANNSIPLELFFFSPGEIEVEGTLKANINGEKMLYSQISLKFLNNYVPVNETEQYSVEKTCSELGGKICTTEESCDAETVYAKDNVCCLGECKSTKKGNSTGVIIAIIILVIMAGGLFWFYKRKYKKAKKPVNLLDIAKGKD